MLFTGQKSPSFMPIMFCDFKRPKTDVLKKIRFVQYWYFFVEHISSDKMVAVCLVR